MKLNNIYYGKIFYTLFLLLLFAGANAWDKPLDIKSADGSWSAQIGGHIMFDSGFYINDDTRQLNDNGDETEIRRARLYLGGKFLHDFDYKAQFDFTSDQFLATWRDVTISYGKLPLGFSVKVGNFKEPFGLNELTGSKYITFLERSSANALSPGRSIGIAFNKHTKQLTYTAGIFGENITTRRPIGHGFAITGRVSYSPVHEDKRAIHLGVATSWRQTNQDNLIRFRARPEAHLTDTRFVDTRGVCVDDFFRFGLEAAWVHNNISLQGEYILTEVNGATEGNGSRVSDPSFDGFYLQMSYFLTGESRNYRFKNGAFKQAKVLRPVGEDGYGAWEIATRYSNIDLSSLEPLGNGSGGTQDSFTIGVNWYLNKNLRLMANYIQVLSIDRPGNDAHDVDPGIIQMRAQLYW